MCTSDPCVQVILFCVYKWSPCLPLGRQPQPARHTPRTHSSRSASRVRHVCPAPAPTHAPLSSAIAATHPHARWPPSIMVDAALLCQPPQHLLVTNVRTRQYQRLRRSSRHRHRGLPPILVADHGHPSHILGHSAPAPHTRRPIGLMSATILAAPAYWSSWADTLPVLQAHLPELTHQILEQLNTHSQASPALQAAADAARTLAATGWEPPTWAAIASSQTQAPAPPPAPAEGPIARGWQHKASTTAHARLKAELFTAIPPASQALVTSQSGPFASRAFTTIPYTNDFAYPSHLFRILLLRRLRLPLPRFARTCRCRRTFDSLGDHRAACAQSGVLRSRGGPLERAAARVCREAGARVTTHTRLADLNVQHVQHIDDRRIEVIANGLALCGGAQLAVDTTLVSPLTRAGAPRRRAGRFAAAALHDARKAKERTYPELVRNSRCRLVVLGIEVGGRWSEEAAAFITNLARAKTRDTPAPLRHAATASLISRWTAFLTHAALSAFAASLLFEDPAHHHNLDGEPPPLSDLLAQLPSDPTDPSRLPLIC